MDHSSHDNHDETTAKDYLAFAGVIAFIFLTSYIMDFFHGDFNGTRYMREFMAVFFLVFGLFKLIDLPGFVMSYIGYDIVAKKFKTYAYVYPFIELALALGFFFNWPGVNIVTVIVMAVGSIGVIKQLLRGSKIRCACLGTYIKLPLTTVSLIEDISMGLMAAYLLINK